MGKIWIKEFTGGLDARRLPETQAGGTLVRAMDGHINRGGQFEKRQAFVKDATLPVGTVGLAYTQASKIVFGHAPPPPSLPPGYAYQRLQHPDGTTALAEVPSWSLFGGKIYAVGVFGDGARYHFYDGVRVAAWVDGRARSFFDITGGSGGGQVNSITVGGIQILGSAVSWTTSTSATAVAVAAQINTFTSTPEYTASAVGNRVIITAAATGTAANGLVVAVTATGISFTAPGAMGDGAVDTGTFQPGAFVRTLGKKMYAVSGPYAHFSAIKDPTTWQTSGVGAGFIDMSQEDIGSEDLMAIGKYQQNVAWFADRTIQIWYMDPDPAQNKQVQVLGNTGTISPRSVTQFGDADLFYLDSSGLRSLRARDASNAASTTDIGSPIDPLLVSLIQSLTTIDLLSVIGLIEPTEGRFWLIIRDQIYVFSYFTGAKVSAWSTYRPGFVTDYAIVYKRKVYLRAGDNVYVFGGPTTTPVYDQTEAEAWLPFLDAGSPTVKKRLTAIDVSCRGEWAVSMAMQPGDLNPSDKLAIVNETTFNQQNIPAVGETTHFGLRFRSRGDGAAILGSAVIHFDGGPDEE